MGVLIGAAAVRAERVCVETVIVENKYFDYKSASILFSCSRHQYTDSLYSSCISTSDLLGTAVKKVMLTEMKIIISLDMAGLRKLILDHAKADFPNGEFKSIHELVVPYKKTRASKGAIVIQPEGSKKGMFDLPPQELKKLIQGFVWLMNILKVRPYVKLLDEKKCPTLTLAIKSSGPLKSANLRTGA